MFDDRGIESKFAGRDGFHWFIGQVPVDPAWREFPGDKQSRKYGYRAKVRVLGKHPGTDDVTDEELPWAHILVPASQGAGVNYAGVSNFIQGGETVIGFYADGEDAQQPIILGALYQHSLIKGALKWDDVLDKGTSGFSAITVDSVLETGGSETALGASVRPTNKVRPSSVGSIPNNDQEIDDDNGKPVQTAARHILDKPVEIRKAVKCDVPKSAMGDVAKTMSSFIEVIKGLEETKEGFIDPILNRAVNIDKIIGEVSDRISGNMSGFIRRARSDLFQKIDEEVGKALTFLSPDNLIKKIELKKQKDIAYCLMENVINGLRDMIGGFLKGMLGKIINFPLCAAEQFLGGLISKITDTINGVLGPVMSAIGALAGIALPNFSSIMNKATGALQAGLKLMKCEGSECDPKPFDWAANVGPDPKKVLDLKRMLDVGGLIDGIDKGVEGFLEDTFPFIGQAKGIADSITGSVGQVAGVVDTIQGTVERVGSAGKILGGVTAELAGGCNTSAFECGPPSIEIFGGGGIGAVAKAVVNSVGEVVGANMEDLGLGFDDVPFVSIVDRCNNGRGATGTAVVKDGKVTNIIITNPGSGYLGGGSVTVDTLTPIGVDSDGNVIQEVVQTETQKPGGSAEGEQVIGEVDGIQVINTGNGYEEGDTIITENGGVLTPIIENGRILGATGVVDVGLDKIPALKIKSKTGFGAYIRPITKFTKIEQYEKPLLPTAQVITVIDCPKGY
tara:strand:+ start:2397 stop:4598 length:2202 start_codon:yes stop_codon:yes gene_type:complete